MSDHVSAGRVLVEANPLVLQEHIEQASYLFEQRDSAVDAPDYSLDELCDLDDRLERHIRGILSAGSMAVRELSDCMLAPEAGTVFISCAVALSLGDGVMLSKVVDAVSNRAHQRAVESAVAWVPETHFHGFANTLLRASSLTYQYIGLTGFANRRWDLGDHIGGFLRSSQKGLRIRACRAIGEAGKKDLVLELPAHFDSEDPRESFWSIWSACLLGYPSAMPRLRNYVEDPAFAEQAIQVYFRFCDTAEARLLLKLLASKPALERYAMMGSGVLGDPIFVPGLISRMSTPALARVASEAFCLITGMDSELVADEDSDKEIESNEQFEWDEDLSWPNQSVVEQWWKDNHSRFQSGQRYLCGRAVDAENCKRVLSVGLQRQRIAAAFELAQLTDKQPLFSWKAPGLNQKKAISEL